jgi:hypothetical protein
MRFKFTLLNVLCLLLCVTSFGQNEDNNWVFGIGGGLNFNSGSPVSFTSTLSNQNISASVSDRNGNLLFYTDGIKLRDKNNNVMPNGSNLMDSTILDPYFQQSALIVPFVNDTNKYYVFCGYSYSTLDNNLVSDTIYYSVLDMQLNGGLGDVVPGQKMLPLGGSLTSLMVAVPGENCNTWLVIHQPDTTFFNVYEITSAGLNTTPTVYNSGTLNGTGAYSTGEIKASSDNTHLAIVTFNAMPYTLAAGFASTVEVHNFNPATGAITNCRVIDSLTDNVAGFKAVCFSPDNSKLYVSAMSISGVFQYDLSLSTLSAITSSRTDVSQSNGYILSGGLQTGPDGKLYVSPWGIPYTSIDRIEFPNLAGTACNYVSGAVALSGGSMVSGGFPQKIVHPVLDTLYSNVPECSGFPVKLSAPSGLLYYSWFSNTSTGPVSTADSFMATQNGTYWVISKSDCVFQVDTFVVERADTAVTLAGSTLTSAATNATFQWIDCGTNQPIAGATGSSFTAAATGNYAVTVTVNGCSQTSECRAVIGLAVNDIALQSLLKTYPNPASTSLVIENNSDITIYEINVLTAQGALAFKVTSKAGTRQTINLGGLSTGVYFIQFITDQGAVSRKFDVIK